VNRQKVKGSRDLLLKFGNPLHISGTERLELEISNVACKLITRGANDKNARIGQIGSERSHVTYI